MSRVRPMAFVHVVYRTRRFAEMLEWYKTVFDASLDDLLENYSQLKARGITPYWCVHHGVTVSMYYADPDGNQMEFQVDCFESNDDANAFMSGPGFAENPIGVEYDPNAWLVQKRAEASITSKLLRQRHEPVSPIRGALGVI